MGPGRRFLLHMTDDTQTQTNVLRDDNGRFLAPPPGSESTRITTANARTLAQKRWEKYRRAAVQRILGEAQSIDGSVQTPADAFGLVAAKQYTTLMDSDKPRVADLEKLGQIMTGHTATGENSQRANEPPAGALVAAPETLMQLVDMIERERSAAVDRARAVDTTTRSDGKG